MCLCVEGGGGGEGGKKGMRHKEVNNYDTNERTLLRINKKQEESNSVNICKFLFIYFILFLTCAFDVDFCLILIGERGGGAVEVHP